MFFQEVSRFSSFSHTSPSSRNIFGKHTTVREDSMHEDQIKCGTNQFHPSPTICQQVTGSAAVYVNSRVFVTCLMVRGETKCFSLKTAFFLDCLVFSAALRSTIVQCLAGQLASFTCSILLVRPIRTEPSHGPEIMRVSSGYEN